METQLRGTQYGTQLATPTLHTKYTHIYQAKKAKRLPRNHLLLPYQVSFLYLNSHMLFKPFWAVITVQEHTPAQGVNPNFHDNRQHTLQCELFPSLQLVAHCMHVLCISAKH